MSGMSWRVRLHGLLSALAGSQLVVRSGRSAQAARGGPGNPQGFTIPRGYEAVDPRTARRVPLWQELSLTNPVFPGDPPFTFDLFTTVTDAGYQLERITSLGTHTGTHVSAPAHVVEGALTLGELDEGWTLMPLAVIDVRERVADAGGDFVIDVGRLREFERKYGEIPPGGCVLLLTGFSRYFTRRLTPDRPTTHFDRRRLRRRRCRGCSSRAGSRLWARTRSVRTPPATTGFTATTALARWDHGGERGPGAHPDAAVRRLGVHQRRPAPFLRLPGVDHRFHPAVSARA
jgi:hypothetical protein